MSPSVVNTMPDIQGLIPEDETPGDNLPAEQQQRLLPEPVSRAWAGPGDGRPFLAAANVGMCDPACHPAIVPDMFLSLDVQVADDWWPREHRSYFLWEFGPPPALVLAIVANTVAAEEGQEKHTDTQIRITYSVIDAPLRQGMPDVFTVYRRCDFGDERQETAPLPRLKLGWTLGEGQFEGKHDTW